MPVSHQISTEHNLGRMIGKGVVNDHDVLLAIRALLSDSAFKRGLDMFIDLRKLENFAVTTSGIREIAMLINEDSRVKATARVAVIVGDVFTLGMVKMFQSLTLGALPMQLVTLDFDESLRFLKLDAPLEAIFA